MKKLLLLLFFILLLILISVFVAKIPYRGNDLGAQVIKTPSLENSGKCLKVVIDPIKRKSSVVVVDGISSPECNNYSNGKNLVGFYFNLPEPNYISLINYTGGLCVSINIQNIRAVTSRRVASFSECTPSPYYYKSYLDIEKALKKDADLHAENYDPDSVCLKKERVLKCDGKGGTEALAETARKYLGRVRYSQEKRNTTNEDNSSNLDCSSYVAEVFKCVGLKSPGNTTDEIFNKRERIAVNIINEDGNVINGRQLKPGDLLGWVPAYTTVNGKQVKKSQGHVVMYIGNGKIINVQGTGGNNALTSAREYDLKNYSYKSKIKFVIFRTTP